MSLGKIEKETSGFAGHHMSKCRPSRKTAELVFRRNASLIVEGHFFYMLLIKYFLYKKH
jgi:hypothetical protein